MRQMLAVSCLVLGLGVTAVVPASASSSVALRLANANATNTGYVRVPNDAAFSLQAFTFEVWVQQVGLGYGQTTDGSGASIIAKPSEGSIGSDIASWHLSWTNSGQLVFNLTHTLGSTGVYVASAPVATPFALHHVAATFDGATVQLYVDGVPNGSVAWSLGAVYYGPEDVLIGADNFGFGYLRRFDGYIDDVRVWDHALTPAQIASSMNCGLTGRESGLVAYWAFDDSTLTDRTGHGHNGTAVATAGAVSYAALAPLGACTAGVGDQVVPGAHGIALSLFPQPASDRFTVSFELPRPGAVTVDVLDVAGRRLAVLDSREYEAGSHQLRGMLSDLPARGSGSGVVFVRVRSGGQSAVRMLVLRR